MESTAGRAIAIVGVGAVLPDAPNVTAFWENIKQGRYSISEVTPDRWDASRYYDADPNAPDKTYSKIGGWVREHVWEPLKWHLPIPPRVASAMDLAQQWAIASTREALEDYGYPKRPLDVDRTAVILGNAMAGEKHYLTSFRVYFPEYAHELEESASFAALPDQVRREITRELHQRIGKRLPEITEDSMPGELANCIAGRIANLYNFHGPNFVTDAACASALAGISAAVKGLLENDFDAAITGGIDRNMGAPTFVKFCKIGALSATGSRPYAAGADGFVMGEGTVIFLLKRLADAERNGDNIYAVLRGIAGSSDGKGKGITAPNPLGQKLCVERAWQNADLSPATASYIEGHGTSTRVGDVVEVQSFADVLNTYHLPPHSIALGSVKSNIGHLKGAAGAAGMLKTALSLRDKLLPPSIHCEHPNPDIDFAHSPLYVNTELTPWTAPADNPRRAGVSAFGFGGTNFHAVLEEFVPGKLSGNGKRSVTVNIPAALAHEGAMNTKPISGNSSSESSASIISSYRTPTAESSTLKLPLRGALVIGADSNDGLSVRLRAALDAASVSGAPAPVPPGEADLRARERVAIDYGDTDEFVSKVTRALKALTTKDPSIWKVLRAQGIFRGHGPATKVAFLYTGQGSQYVNMLGSLRSTEPIVADTFAEADRVLTSLLGKPLTEFIFVDESDPTAVAKAEEDLRQTAITQPAVLATDIALTRMLAAYGITPDMTMGHSLGEYGALVASGALPFSEALEAVSARGREMTRVSMADNGRMAAVFAPLPEIERIVGMIKGYVVIANINSNHQAVIGGGTKAVEEATEAFQKAGYTAVALPVSHAFHTSIVAPASEPLRQMLTRLHLQAPRVPIIANISGEFYPMQPGAVPEMIDILARQVAAPVQFSKGLQTLYEAGARLFVETGPKKALHGFVEDVLGENNDVVALFTNHPKVGETVAFNYALCGLYAGGLGRGVRAAVSDISTVTAVVTPDNDQVCPIVSVATPVAEVSRNAPAMASRLDEPGTAAVPTNGNRYLELGRLFADVLDRGWQIYHGQKKTSALEPIAITGAALGLPGTEKVFDDANVARILRGDQFIDAIPNRFRRAMLDKHIIRLVKNENGGPTFEVIGNIDEVIKLAGRGGIFDPESEFGISADRLAALDRVTSLAIGAGIDALRDAGIPLIMRYKTTSKGTQLPDRWGLPDAMRDDTGVIFGSAFPGYDSFAGEMAHFYADYARREKLAMLEDLHARAVAANAQPVLLQEIKRQIDELRIALEKNPYVFDRRFLFRALSMGHSQFAELIGARGPNTQINSACATTTQAIALAEDWIRAGRCRRVIVISADDASSDNLIEWLGAGFLASGAAATDEVVEDAAIPFDRRRHGLIMGMGAAALIVESAEAARERGIRPICEVLSTVTANSAFHGSRLDVQHISGIMEALMVQAEARSGIRRHEIAPQTMFMSHETYTPARGGSASAEIFALRKVFGENADRIVIANTKGFTGHAMGTGIEEVVAVKALETGWVPPVANFKEIDPELGALNLSKGGIYPVEYALRLGAGFGSQISMTLMRWVKTKDGSRPGPNALGYAYRIVDETAWSAWLSRMSGYPASELEVVNRTLRVRDQGAAAKFAEGRPQAASVAAVLPVPAAMLATPVFPAAPEVRPTPAFTEVAKEVVKVQAVAAGASAGRAATTVAPEPQVIPIAPVHVSKSAAVPTAAPTPEGDPVKERILALVAEKTGYPVDMLDLDLDLEADLGVDTVKQAEVFATVREAYGIQRDDTVKLREFPTLAHVIRFVHERRPDLQSEAPVSAPAKQETKPVDDLQPAATLIEQEAGPAPVPAPQTAEGIAEDVKERILALVVEKTGYPKDMLDLELDLEADLGVDTVKQAELFAAIREIYNIPRDQNLKLRDFPTLAHVIQFVYDKRPDLAKTVALAPSAKPVEVAPEKPSPAEAKTEITTSVPAEAFATKATGADVKERILQLVVEKTGYPKDMLDLELDLEADLGVDTVKQAELFAAIREIYNIPRDQNLKLRDFPTLAHVIQFVYDKRPDLAGTATESTSEQKPAQPATAIPSADVVGPVAAEPALIPDDVIKDKVLDIVAEKTGYPKDMLDLELDLEADLGIDTVKQAEMFASVRAAFQIPRDQDLKLRDFPTLAHVIKFAQDRQAGRQSVAAEANVEGVADATRQNASSETSVAPPRSTPKPRPPLMPLDATEAIPRRVPVPVLRPPLAMCKSTGVKLGPGIRAIVMPDTSGVADALTDQLQELGVEVLRLDPAMQADALADRIKNWLSAGPIHGVYWLPALDIEAKLSDMDLAAWHEALRVRIKALYVTMRTLYEQVAARGTFLLSGTRLGGQHGYDQAGATAPLGGAVCGFTKTYKRERAEVLVKAVDFEAHRNTAEIARLLIEESLRDSGAVEVGYKDGQRWAVALLDEPASDGQAGLALNEETVFLITGAAGSIVSAITADLAAASGGTFYLLDLVPKPDPDNPDLKRFANDKENLKRDLFARIQARGERATPALVEKELAALERAQAAQSAIDAVTAAGGTAQYFSADIRDGAAIAKIIDMVRDRSGRIDVLLHAAGMERSHFLPDKDAREFDLIFDVKSDGWFNLLHAIGNMRLGATVAFSSIAGRFGNAGQTDYSSANDLLCKITSSFRTTRPATRGIVIDWTAWGGIGMATRGSIPKMMELAAIDMLPPEAGIPFIRRELTAGATRGEVVVGKRLGVLLNEFDETGGLDPTASTSEGAIAARGPVAGRITAMRLHSGLVVETTLDPAVQPFLHDHQIDGTPVLPGVMGIEAFAEAALSIVPGWHVETIQNIKFLAPFKFYRSEPRTITVEAMLYADGDKLIADCELSGRRKLPNQAEPQKTVHFTARVRLTRYANDTAPASPPSGVIVPTGPVIEAADIYRVYFHGPAYQVLGRAWRDGNRIIGELAKNLPHNHVPFEQPTAMAPRLIELCFQTAGLWELSVDGRFGLPHAVQDVRSFCTSDRVEGALFAIVTPNPDGATFDAEVVDGTGRRYVHLSGYGTVAMPSAVDAEPLKALRVAA